MGTIGFDGQCDVLRTTWAGLPTPVETTKIAGETVAETVRRHNVSCLLAAAEHPIQQT
jgi:hypothetical protein